MALEGAVFGHFNKLDCEDVRAIDSLFTIKGSASCRAFYLYVCPGQLHVA